MAASLMVKVSLAPLTFQFVKSLPLKSWMKPSCAKTAGAAASMKESTVDGFMVCLAVIVSSRRAPQAIEHTGPLGRIRRRFDGDPVETLHVQTVQCIVE